MNWKPLGWSILIATAPILVWVADYEMDVGRPVPLGLAAAVVFAGLGACLVWPKS